MPEPFDKTDDVIARKLAEIAPPADLRARLLAIESESVVEAASVNWWARGITAVAAAIVVAFTIFSIWPQAQTKSQPIADAKSDMATFLSNGFELALKTPDVNQVREWLAANNPAHPVTLPDALAQNPTIGCRELMWRGHAGRLACFHIKDGKEAHLAMFPEKTFSDAPGSSPQIASSGAWTSAAWSRDGMTYILFVPAGMNPVKEFLSALLGRRFGKIAFNSPAWHRARGPRETVASHDGEQAA